MKKNIVLCFDLDGVICKTIKNYYSKSLPIKKNVKFINLLFESKLCCFYCKDIVYLLYEKSREMKQWSLDRINNGEGHNKDNVIVACLHCNLQRRNRGKDAFLFTKQLTIVKSDT